MCIEKNVDHVLKNDDFFIMYIKMLIKNLKKMLKQVFEDQEFENC